MVNFLIMVAMALFVFDVPVKGSFLALCPAAFLYVMATTGLGLVISAFSRTQTAALFGTAIATALPAVQFSGMMQPVSSLEGRGAAIGQAFPTTHFLTICVGVFIKALGFGDLRSSFLALAAFAPVLMGMSALLLPEQER